MANNDRRTLPIREKRRQSLTRAAISSPTHRDHDPLREFRTTREWPPRRYTLDSTLDPHEAEDLVTAGASTFKGYWDAAPSAPAGHYRFYAVMENEHAGRNDRAICQHEAFRDVSLMMTGPAEVAYPWVALEQPCMAYCFGKRPGTTTLNYRVSRSGSLKPVLQYGAEVRPRRIKLMRVLDRLRVLEEGLVDDDPDELYHSLYTSLLEDPDANEQPHVGIEMQMTDLLTVLTNQDWIDFSKPKNQVVAKFFDSQDQEVKHRFFHQLLLATELHLRIHSEGHLEKAKRQLLQQLPPKVLWDLALAQRWLENMTITKKRTASNQSTFSFELKSKRRQKDALRTFGKILKWPNMSEVEFILEEKSRKEVPIEDRSADAMSWFTGVVLPGPTLPWLLINTLIDCDKDTGDALKYLTHMHPASGFQYKANTYWSHKSIVGKVLGAARGVNQVAGWIGPCSFSPDLKRTECVRIKQAAPPEPKLTRLDVESMAERSEPLGPKDDAYPVNDFELVLPELDDITDVIRVEKLSFVPVQDQPRSKHGGAGPLLFDAAVQFACGGDSWPFWLRFDVDFLNAYPCHEGPHVLFYDYRYRAIRVDDGLVDISEWGPRVGDAVRTATTAEGDKGNGSGNPASTFVDTVLVIEALGVSDNEVFARAWCAHTGHSAIVARLGQTCLACAIREAYAACVGVVILTEGGRRAEGDV
ncbi:hypothetical protein K490DRAFT_48520 [Saccharata proteae CBS 121410]|uniref:Uncharacterized protein n=1 Tax=Saccharata proteae CBS 121410 TaxID=1314787 RepID=A0A9P4HPV1_9PEZI|nr:hypothetical protein K490DRAFT_48520 [Saccharata proteae CBS 121410]